MTEDIIKMAQEAGFAMAWMSHEEHQCIERFAKLVAAAEREACAKVCEIPSDWEDSDLICGAQGRQLCNDLARSIRARSQQC